MDERAAPIDAIARFLAVASARPDHDAVRAQDNVVTYGGLEALTRRYAATFARSSTQRVLIVLPRGPHAYAAMLGAGLAGGFYAPANETSPLEKLQNIAAQLDPDIIVAPAELGHCLARECCAASCLDPAGLPGEMFEGTGTRHAIAYVIFTSGSTGQPKGVVIPRTGLNHYVAWIERSESVVASDLVAQFSNLGFDFSVFDIYGALCLGATLVPVDGHVDRMLPARAVAREGITLWASVPSVLTLMMNAEDVTCENLRSVRQFMFCGEPLLRLHLEALFAAKPDLVVQNTYGPTEATVTMTELKLTRDNYVSACGGASVAFGPPISGMQLHLVGGASEAEGEIVIAGPQLAAGYWGDPDRTAASFRNVEIGGVVARHYFTGDWGERRDGHIYFKERIDFQVKVHGHRIELDEVAEAIRKCGWPSVCVFKRNEALVALVEGRCDADALREALASHLDTYSIPEEIHGVARLPRNENDKIDRKAALRMMETKEALLF